MTIVKICLMIFMSFLKISAKKGENLDLYASLNETNYTVASFDFENFTLEQDYYIINGLQFHSFHESFDYKPNPELDEYVTLTDVASINNQASNGEYCTIPFDLNGIENYFCAKNPSNGDAIQCDTQTGFSDCNLGQFMLVKRGPRGIIFGLFFEFAQELDLKSDTFYELDFNYLINKDVCSQNDLQLIVHLNDKEYFKEVLFDSNDDETASAGNNLQWNNHKQCFKIMARTYYLMVDAKSSCLEAGNEAFIAIDDVSIRTIDDLDFDGASCRDISVTELPDYTQETQETKETTEYYSSSNPTIIIDEQTTSEDISSSLEPETTTLTTNIVSETTQQSVTDDSSQTQSSHSSSTLSLSSSTISNTIGTTDPQTNTSPTTTSSTFDGTTTDNDLTSVITSNTTVSSSSTISFSSTNSSSSSSSPTFPSSSSLSSPTQDYSYQPTDSISTESSSSSTLLPTDNTTVSSISTSTNTNPTSLQTGSTNYATGTTRPTATNTTTVGFEPTTTKDKSGLVELPLWAVILIGVGPVLIILVGIVVYCCVSRLLDKKRAIHPI